MDGPVHISLICSLRSSVSGWALNKATKRTDSRGDLILWDGTCSISPAVRMGIVPWLVAGETMDGMTRVLIPGFLDKFIWMNVLGEGHGKSEKQSGAFHTYSL